MGAPPFHLLLLVASLSLCTVAAAHLHLDHHGHGPHRHHRSPSMMTATARLDAAPSMHQNRMESESEEMRQSLRVLNPFFTTVAAQSPSGEDAMAAMGEAADAADTTRLDLHSPTPPLLAAGDPMPLSLAPPQPQAEEAGSSESGAAAFSTVVDEPYRDAASPPRPPPVTDEPFRDATIPSHPPPVVDEDVASTPPPVLEDAARVVSSGTGDDLGLQQIAKVLASLGYNEMASSAMLLADSTPDVTLPGAITVFAAPDAFLQHACPECSRRHLLLDHMALGYFPYAELAAAPARKLPSASAGHCLDVAAEPQRGPFSVHHASLYVNGVMVSEPELYDDGRYVVHGLHGFIPRLSHASCVEDAHAHHHHQVHLHHYPRRHHHLGARSEATSAATTTSAVRIREAISRLRGSGFSFVALAMRVKFPELEKLSNLTVFALDDQVIFTGGGHGYVSAVRFHIVPGHRLTRADLLLLRPGTILPTLAGEDQKLVITLGAGSDTDEVNINHVAVKEPDVVINSRVAVHGIYLPFPRLHHAALVRVASNLPAYSGGRPHDLRIASRARSGRSAAASDSTRGRLGFTAAAATAAAVAGVALAAVVLNRRRTERRRKVQTRVLQSQEKRLKQKPDLTNSAVCGEEDTQWKATGCQLKFCNNCVQNGFLDTHVASRRASFLCTTKGCELIPLQAPLLDPIDELYVFVGEKQNSDTITKTFIRLDQLQEREVPKSLTITYRRSDDAMVGIRRRSP